MVINAVQKNTSFRNNDGSRYLLLDAIRGGALVWMTLFHAAYDMSYFGWLAADFKMNPIWTWQRTIIVFLFMFCAGCGQSIAFAHGQSWQRFARRWGQIAGCALLVTIASMLVFPQSYIFFGVLHGMAVMLVIARLSAKLKTIWLWLLACLAFLMPFIFTNVLLSAHSPFWQYLNSNWLNWLGLINQKPYTEDFVPIFPWLGSILLGCAVMKTWLRKEPYSISPKMEAAVLGNSVVKLMALLGRHSLMYYMLHQIILLAVFGCFHYLFFK